MDRVKCVCAKDFTGGHVHLNEILKAHYLYKKDKQQSVLPSFTSAVDLLHSQPFLTTHNMRLISVAFAACAFSMCISPSIADIIGFSGNECDGAEGDDVPCDGSCHSFSGRHSFEASVSMIYFQFRYDYRELTKLYVTGCRRWTALCYSI